jgi:hypothetical protein
MTFIWTPPDPLNNSAKTRSIYMTELQAAANARRLEIAQSQLTFINQNIGKKFVLSAIEELKTVVNQLAIDFGYPLGVEDPTLLGRPYVAITKKYGKTVCHYPILNDLRRVLNLLIEQYPNPIVVSRNWAEGDGVFGNPSQFGNFEIAANPIGQVPIYHELPTIVDGFPYATDVSIIFNDKEGPIGGPYNNIPGFGSSNVFDSAYFYELLPSGSVYRWKRDGSSIVKELVVQFSTVFPDYVPSCEDNTWEYITVDDSYIYAVGNKNHYCANLGIEPKAIYGRSAKVPGSIPIKEFWYDVNACDAVPGPIGFWNEEPDKHITAVSMGKPIVKNGIIYVAYRDLASYREANVYGEVGRWWFVGSCIVEIPLSANGGRWAAGGTGLSRIGKETPAIAHTANPWTGPTAYYGHHDIKANSNNYIWMNNVVNQTVQYGRRQDGTFYPPLPPSIQHYFAQTFYSGGKSLYTTDYNGNTINSSTNFGLDTAEAYALRESGPTSDIVVPNFITANRIEGDPNDTIEVVWPQTDGTFYYKVRWGISSDSIFFVGATIASNLHVYSASFQVLHGYTHYIKLELVTGQGDILGDETIVFSMPLPPVPVLLSVGPGSNSGELDVIWTMGSPWVSTDGFIIYYRKVGDTGPWSSIEGGLLGTYTITGLTQGANYDVKVRAYNKSGYSDLSNMLTGMAKL